MWKRGKNTGSAGKTNFSLVHRYIQHFNEVSGNKSGALRKRSKTPGVMITQYVMDLPEGKSTPDFKSKPTPITIDEGKLAVFKVVVNGDPKPEVSWKRAKGNILDKKKFQHKYDESTGEYILEIHKVTGAETDTYKCYAVNEYGKAVCTTTLTVNEASTNPADFRKLLRKSKVDRADGESDEKFWDAMLNADRKDYERICSEFGVTDLHSILKKLEEKKKERAQNKCKDGVIPYDEDEIQKHDLRSVGRTKDFSNKGLMQNDTGLYQEDVEAINLRNAGLNQVDAEEFNILSEEFKLSNVDFVIKIQETKAKEREDALFECVLTHPLPKITWMGKGSNLEDGEKYSITVSDHKLIHRLLIRDCQQLDKGIYSAVAGITSCSAWLVVEAESNLAGKKIARKTTLAGGARIDLDKVAKEQQIKYRQEMEKILASVKAKHEGGQLKEKMAIPTAGGDSKKYEITEPDKNAGAIKDKSDAAKASAQPVGRKGKTKSKSSKGDGTVSKLDISGCVTKADVQLRIDDPKNKKHTKSGRVDYDKVTDANEDSEDNDAFTGPAVNARRMKQSQKSENGVLESSEEYDDADEPDMSTCSQHEVATSNGNKSSSGSVRHQKKTKKVHWKEQTSADGNHLLGDFVSKNSALQDCSELTENPQRKAACVSPPLCGSNTNPNELEKNNDPSENDKDKDSTGQGKHLKGSKQGQKPKDAVSGKRHPNELGKNNEPSESESDEDEDSTGQIKHLKGSKQGQKPKDAVSGKRHPKVLESDNVPSESHNEPCENDEDEESTVHVKHLKGSKQGQTPKNAVRGKRRPNELESDNEPSESDEDGDSPGQVKHLKRSKKVQKPKDAVNGESTCPKDDSTCDETEDVTSSSTHTKRKRQGPLIEDLVIDPGVQFIWGLSDVNAIINETAKLTCKLSSEDCEGVWFRDNKKISPDDNFSITKDGPIHKLVIIKCQDEHSGKYRFEADGRKTEAMINVKDPPRFYPDDLSDFTEPVIIKVGHNAIFKLHFVGFKPIKIKWYREGEELHDDTNIKIEKSESHSRLLLSRCQRKDTGEIKIKLKNEHGFTEAVSQLIVLDKPTSPLGPAEVTESSAACIEFRWRPPKDDGGSPVINYMMERQQVGRNTWKKIGEIPGVPCYRDTDVDRGRKYCYRIRAVTAEGTSEVMETDEMQAGTLAFPGPPAPPKVVSAFDDCINLSWASPSNTGGSRILGYILEKRKKGSNLWTVVNATDELIKEKKYGVKDVVEGMEYEFRVTAINLSGPGESSNPSEFVFARDPKKPPGKVTGLKVTETSYTHFVLTWTKPEEKPGIQDEARGYFVEIRQADCMEWSRCNSSPFIMTSFSVKGLKSMDMYWVRVIATNDGGESVPEELSNYVLAMPLPVRPKFTNNKMKTFMVVRAGNSVRITVNFEASPQPDIMWLKDNVPVAKRVTISNSDGSSQLLIPSSERSDSGIYSILVKNLVGQETFSTEVRVTDDPKPPGPVELEENVPGTVTVTWEPSPDEKRDDRLHYTVSKLDSTKRTWATVADRLFNNKFTVCNIMHGREYHFRVYAKNDMGISAPSESPTWGMEKKKEKFVISVPTRRDCDLRCAPTFIVPLKLHTAPKGYECYMSCAVKGNPTPRITWYRNHISLNTNTNYYISNTCGVCSMLILRVGPKDMGEYTITAENSLGRAECSTVLSVRE